MKIGNLDVNKVMVGSDEVTAIYAGTDLVYSGGTPPTPTGSTCYEVISEPITSYTSTTYDSVFTYNDEKWYMKNNLNQYEQYGIYDVVNDISTATTYEGKLGIVGETEYQYSGDSWSVVGSYVDSSVTYTIDDTDPSPYVGQELSTTFKIPYADVQAIDGVDFYITTNDGDLNISLNDVSTEYTYDDGSEHYEGTVTDDGEYFYLSLPSEAPQSIVIEEIGYFNEEPIHLIFGSKQVTVEYEEKSIPLDNVYNTVADMESEGCPNVGVGQYGVVGNDAYQFDGEDWNSFSNYKIFEKNADGKANVIACNSIAYLDKKETQPSYFGNASGITYAKIGDCVTSIGNNAFISCGSLTSVTIGSGVTSIGNSAFYSCSGLTSVTIPDSVTSIDGSAFLRCSSLTSVTIGSGVTSIGKYAFGGCTSLTSINIPSGVTSIGDSAFNGCSSLTSLTIPDSVTSIGEQVFYQCSGLTSVTIPDSVTNIGKNTFRDCRSLTSVTIPNNVTNIGDWTFYNCSSLTSVTVLATTPPTSGTYVFNNTNDCPIYVPASSVSAYQSASRWSSYADRIQAIP